MNSNEIISQVIDDIMDEDIDEYMSSVHIYEEHTFSERHNKKMQKLIKRQRSPLFRFTNTAGKRAACIIAAILIVSAFSLSVKAIREPVFNFVSSLFSDHREVSIESGTDSGYSKMIEEEYYISELPEGFEQTEYSKTDTGIVSMYKLDNGFVLFEQTVKCHYKEYYDNERSEFNEYIDSNGDKYMIVSNNFDTTYIWDNGQYIFEITSNLDKEFILKLCKSTKKKENAHNLN